MLTRSALESELRPYRGRVYRIVEAQHRISTNRLADSNADQALLEALVDEVKPALPESAWHLPWLLASPFRYGLGRPSRFRGADLLPGILYASEAIETAVAEAAHWRMVAFSRSPGFRLPRTPTPMSAFSTLVTTERLLDLLAGSMAARRADWTHPTDYAQTQALADVARSLNTGAIRAPSARLEGRVNVAVLDPAALDPNVRPHSSWAFLVTHDGLLAIKELSDQIMRFSTPEF